MTRRLVSIGASLALLCTLGACAPDSGDEGESWQTGGSEEDARNGDVDAPDTGIRKVPPDARDTGHSKGDTGVDADTTSCEESERPEAVALASGGGAEDGSAISVPALSRIELDASRSSAPDGAIATYRWSLLERPQGSQASVPDERARETYFLPDKTGTFRIQLEVAADGSPGCSATDVVEITATSTDKIRVRLTWSTPGDADETDDRGTDLNIHYLNADEPGANWNEAPWDIYWQNPRGNWGDEGSPADDPKLDVDDTDGAGPENIVHPNPEPGRYSVAVEHYDASGFGPSDAKVTIYVDGTIVQTYTRSGLSGSDVWYVADIVYDDRRLAKVDDVTTGFPTN